MTYRSTTLAGLCLAALIAGCGGSSGDSADKASPATKAQQKEHRGGTLTMLWNGAGTSIDTTLDYDSNWQVLTMTSDGLLNYRRVAGAKGSELVPDLAQQIPPGHRRRQDLRLHSLRAAPRNWTARRFKAQRLLFRVIERAPSPCQDRWAVLPGHRRRRRPRQDIEELAIVEGTPRPTTAAGHRHAPPDGADPDFLQKLGVVIPPAYVVPSNTPVQEVGTSNPLPQLGLYIIDHYTPNQEYCWRAESEFHELVEGRRARKGHPDKIDIRLRRSTSEAEVTMVEHGQADQTCHPAALRTRLDEIATQYTNQVHLNPAAAGLRHGAEHLGRPVRQRQGAPGRQLRDRPAAIIQGLGWLQVWPTPTCRRSAAVTSPATRPTARTPPILATASGTAPDMAKAQQLVAVSGTKGQKAAVICTPDEARKAINLYFVSLLNQLGDEASIKALNASVEHPTCRTRANKAQLPLLATGIPDFISGSTS